MPEDRSGLPWSHKWSQPGLQETRTRGGQVLAEDARQGGDGDRTGPLSSPKAATRLYNNSPLGRPALHCGKSTSCSPDRTVALYQRPAQKLLFTSTYEQSGLWNKTLWFWWFNTVIWMKKMSNESKFIGARWGGAV